MVPENLCLGLGTQEEVYQSCGCTQKVHIWDIISAHTYTGLSDILFSNTSVDTKFLPTFRPCYSGLLQGEDSDRSGTCLSYACEPHQLQSLFARNLSVGVGPARLVVPSCLLRAATQHPGSSSPVSLLRRSPQQGHGVRHPLTDCARTVIAIDAVRRHKKDTFPIDRYLRPEEDRSNTVETSARISYPRWYWRTVYPTCLSQLRSPHFIRILVYSAVKLYILQVSATLLASY